MKKKNNFRKIAMAIAAAGFLGCAPTPVLSYELSAAAVMQQTATYVEDGQAENAITLLERLQALGVTRIEFDGQSLLVADLVALLRLDTPAARAELLRLLALVADAEIISFFANQRVVASVDSELLFDAFPTGSAG
jgi:hypothetical protein